MKIPPISGCWGEDAVVAAVGGGGGIGLGVAGAGGELVAGGKPVGGAEVRAVGQHIVPPGHRVRVTHRHTPATHPGHARYPQPGQHRRRAQHRGHPVVPLAAVSRGVRLEIPQPRGRLAAHRQPVRQARVHAVEQHVVRARNRVRVIHRHIRRARPGKRRDPQRGRRVHRRHCGRRIGQHDAARGRGRRERAGGKNTVSDHPKVGRAGVAPAAQ